MIELKINDGEIHTFVCNLESITSLLIVSLICIGEWKHLCDEFTVFRRGFVWETLEFRFAVKTSENK